MDRHLSINFKKIILWVTGYISIVAYVITGGFFFYKDDERNVLDTCKEVFSIAAIYSLIDAINKLILSLINMNGYSTGFNDYLIILEVFKLVTFIVFFVLDLLNINIFRKKMVENIEDNKSEE